MLVDLATPTTQALKEFNERAERPYIIADSCLLDGGAVELEIGGITVAGIFHPEDAYALALGVLDMETPEPPRQFDSVEWQEANLSEDELEWQAWSALTALQSLRAGGKHPVSPSVALVAPLESVEARELVESTLEPEDGSQSLVAPKRRIGSDFMWNRDTYYGPRFLEPVGVMSHEEVAARFDATVTGAVA